MISCKTKYLSWGAACLWHGEIWGTQTDAHREGTWLERSLKLLSLSISNLCKEHPWLKSFTGHIGRSLWVTSDMMHGCLLSSTSITSVLFLGSSCISKGLFFFWMFILSKLRHHEQRGAHENCGLKIRQQELFPAGCGNSQPCYSVFLPGTGTYWPQKQCQKSQVHIPV